MTIQNTVPTHNEHILVRPKKMCLFWEMCLLRENVLILGSGEFRIFLKNTGYLFFRNPPLTKISTFSLSKQDVLIMENVLIIDNVLIMKNVLIRENVLIMNVYRNLLIRLSTKFLTLKLGLKILPVTLINRWPKCLVQL